MGRTVSGPQDFSKGSINEISHQQTCTFKCYCASDVSGDYKTRIRWGWGYSSSPATDDGDGENENGSTPPPTAWLFSQTFQADCDDNIYTRTLGTTYGASPTYPQTWEQGKNQDQGKTNAATPTLGSTPTLDNAQTTSIRVNNSATDVFTPATKDTGVTLYIQYRVNGIGSYVNWPTPLKTSQTGYTSRGCGTTTVTGLDPDTSYQFRYHLDRTGTSNGTTSYFSSASALSTLPDVPEATTQAATGVSPGAPFPATDDGTAYLNGTFDRNAKTDLQWRFGYDTVTRAGGAYTFNTAWTNSTTEPETIQKQITGLTESQQYFFRLELRYNIGADFVYGSELNFTVPANPGQFAPDEEHMQTIQLDGQYGVAMKFGVTLRAYSTDSSDLFYTGPVPIVGSESVLYTTDFAASGSESISGAATLSQAITVVNTYLYVISLTAAEMQGQVLDIVLHSSDLGTRGYRDAHIKIRTTQRLSKTHYDTTQMGSVNDVTCGLGSGNHAGLHVEGLGTGVDILGVMRSQTVSTGTATGGGAAYVDLAANENGNNDIYNDHIMLIYSMVTGHEQAKIITDYDGTLKRATVDSSWIGGNPASGDKYTILPGPKVWAAARAAELSSIPTATSSYGDKLQFLWQRFAYKVDQTATTQTWYKAGGTVYGTKTVSDNGVTQVLGAIS